MASTAASQAIEARMTLNIEFGVGGEGVTGLRRETFSHNSSRSRRAAVCAGAGTQSRASTRLEAVGFWQNLESSRESAGG